MYTNVDNLSSKMECNTQKSYSQMSTQSQPETQEVGSQQIIQNIEEDKAWGRLLSLCNISVNYNLTDDHYTFGRGNVTHRLSGDSLNESLLSTISKLHFQIYRQKTPDSEVVVILEDNSQNGTYINRVLVGKNKKKILQSNDEISLSLPNSKVFIFYDCINNDSKYYPIELCEKYTIMKKLGHGTYGEVRLAYCQGTLQRVAIKIMEKKILSVKGTTVRGSNMLLIENEVKLLQSVDHPCIVKLLDIIEGPEKIYIVMEVAEGGELFDRIANSKRLKEPVAKMYFYQLVHAVAYLHQMKITHRDIKPENILLNSEDEYTRIKLTDFGLSKLTPDATIMTSLCGTPNYIAPELLNLDGRGYDNKVDVWSLGVVLFVSLAGYAPFSGNTNRQTQYNILNGLYKMNEMIFDEVSDNAKDLISKLFVVDPTVRLSAKQILEHKWMQDPEMVEKAQNLMGLSVRRSPRKRCLDEDNQTYERDQKTPKLMSGIQYNLGQQNKSPSVATAASKF